MFSALLELFAYGLISAVANPTVGDAIVRGLNPLYEWLLSVGL